MQADEWKFGGNLTNPNMDFLNQVTCPIAAYQQQPIW